MSRTGRSSTILLLVSATLLLLPAFALGAAPLTSAPAPVPHPSEKIQAGPNRPSTSVRPVAGPIHGQYYTQSNSSFPDGFGFPILAVDPTTQVLYGLDEFHGFLSAVNLTTGALVASAIFAPDPSPDTQALGLSYVPDHDQIIVSYDWGSGGALLVYSASSLTLLENLSVFPGYPGYAPARSVYIPQVDQLWVQDAEHGGIEILNANSLTVVQVLPTTPGCGGGCPSLGIIAVPRHGYVLTGNVQNYLDETSLSNYTSFATLPGPNAEFGFGPMAYATASDQVWVDNFSGVDNGNIARFNASTNAFLGNVPANATAFGTMAYDPADSAMLVSSRNATLCDSTDALLWLNSSTGALRAHSCGSPFPLDPTASYTALAPVDLASGVEVAATAPGGAELYALTDSPTPSISALLSYARIAPAEQLLSTGTGPLTLNVGAAPNGTTLSLYDPLTGLTNWSEVVRPLGPVAVESAYALAYVANGSRPVVDFSLGSGAAQGALAPAPSAPVVGIAIDSVHAWAYLLEQSGRNTSVELYSLNQNGSGALIGTVPLPGVVPCAWAADPALGALAVSSCLYAGAPTGNNLTLVDGLPLHALAPQPTGGYPEALAASDAAGTVYVEDEGSGELTVRNATTGALTTISVPGFAATSLAVDSASRLLIGAVGNSVEVLDLNASNLPVEAVLPAPSTVAAVACDPTGSDLLGLTAWTDQVLSAVPAETPSQVGGLGVMAGNDSLSLHWSPPVNPLVSSSLTYTVSRSNSSTGPWGEPVSSSGPALTVTGLLDGTSYFLRVTANNSAGSGPPSEAVNGTPVAPPFPPSELRATWNSSLVALTWSAPSEDDGAPVTGYQVEWSIESTGLWVSVSAGLGLGYNATNLSHGTTYLFRVVAENRLGASAPSAEVRVPFELPSTGGGLLANPGFDLALLLLGILVAVAVLVIVVRRRRARAYTSEEPEEAPVPGQGLREPEEAEFHPVTDDSGEPPPEGNGPLR